MKKWFRFTITDTNTSYYIPESDAEHTAEEIEEVLEFINAEIKSSLMNYNLFSYNPFELPLDTDYTIEIVETADDAVPDDVVFSYNDMYFFTNNYEVVKEYQDSGNAATLLIGAHTYNADVMYGYEWWYEYITEYNK